MNLGETLFTQSPPMTMTDLEPQTVYTLTATEENKYTQDQTPTTALLEHTQNTHTHK